MPADTIRLHQDRRSITMTVATDSRLSCAAASAPDVYARASVKDEQQELRPGGSMQVKGKSRLSIRLFRTRDVNEPFSAEFLLEARGT